MRYTQSKNKLARREGKDLGLKTFGSKSHASLMRRINIRPGQRSNQRYRKYTEYGQQLREKQRLKRIYGITESSLSRYFNSANRQLGNTAHLIIQILETRLDNVVYKLGIAPTRAAARQIVNHGHILVNKKKVNIPSFLVHEGDVVSFKNEKTAEIPYIAAMLERKDVDIPKWLQRKGTAGKVLEMPSLDDYIEDIDLQSVIEFYSR